MFARLIYIITRWARGERTRTEPTLREEMVPYLEEVSKDLLMFHALMVRRSLDGLVGADPARGEPAPPPGPHDRVPASRDRRLAIRRGITARREPWWTKERVLTGLLRFYRERKAAPTAFHLYHDLVKGSGMAADRRYPSSYAVFKHWPTMRQAWKAAGVPIDNAEESYTDLDDWYIREAIGILTRAEIARDLGRTEGGLKRRMYELGLMCRRSVGWTQHRIEEVAQVPSHLLRKYMDRGDLPFYRGSTFLFFDPADLLVVGEIDWTNPPAELERDVRRSLVERLVRILRGEDWRAGRLFQSHAIRTTDKRWRMGLSKPGPRPNGIVAGDLVRCVGKVEDRVVSRDRVGVVHLVYWRRNTNRSRSDSEPCWIARVEFAKTRHRGEGVRVTYGVPLAALEKVRDGDG